MRNDGLGGWFTGEYVTLKLQARWSCSHHRGAMFNGSLPKGSRSHKKNHFPLALILLFEAAGLRLRAGDDGWVVFGLAVSFPLSSNTWCQICKNILGKTSTRRCWFGKPTIIINWQGAWVWRVQQCRTRILPLPRPCHRPHFGQRDQTQPHTPDTIIMFNMFCPSLLTDQTPTL